MGDLIIKFKKKDLFLLSAITIFLIAIGFVIAIGSNDYQVHGHDAEEIEPQIFGVSCIHNRSEIMAKDSIAYCSSEYPKMMYCSVINSNAPAESPTQMPEGICDSNGICLAKSATHPDLGRGTGSIGTSNAYLELVESNGIEGCWQYDRDSTRTDYRLELVCCK